MNTKIQELTVKVLGKLCLNHDIVIKDDDLTIILRIIKDNPYTVLNDEYTPILLNEISSATNLNVSNRFKPILEKGYLIDEIE